MIENDINKAMTKLKSLNHDDAVIFIEEIIDHAIINKDRSKFEFINSLIDYFSQCDLPNKLKAHVHYLRGLVPDIFDEEDINTNFNWTLNLRQEQLFNYRRNISHPNFNDFSNKYHCKSYNNLVKILSDIGRIVEAIDYIDQAMEFEGSFAKTIHNKARLLIQYRDSIRDDYYGVIFNVIIYDLLNKVSSNDVIYESEYDKTKSRELAKRDKQRFLPPSKDFVIAFKGIDLYNHDISCSTEERDYRNWCLNQKLFLNPLNDLGNFPIAASDKFILPKMFEDHKWSILSGLLNQMKQEFITARYMYYESMTMLKNKNYNHFSDNGTLYNNQEYSHLLGMYTEKMKLAFRMSYSIFDKISCIIDEYFKLKRDNINISFKTIWFNFKKDEHKFEKKDLKQIFENKPNWPLRGLFWMAKEFFHSEFKKNAEPDAVALNVIRNFLEHKYFKLTEVNNQKLHDEVSNSNIIYSLSVDEFSNRCLRLLKRTRAALIHTNLSIRVQEIQNSQKNNHL